MTESIYVYTVIVTSLAQNAMLPAMTSYRSRRVTRQVTRTYGRIQYRFRTRRPAFTNTYLATKYTTPRWVTMSRRSTARPTTFNRTSPPATNDIRSIAWS